MDFLAAKAYILARMEMELSPLLYYHGRHHTIDVLQATEELCLAEQIGPHETLLLKTAAVYHDSGYLIQSEQHEQIGCELARASLVNFAYSTEAIEQICGMIMATKMPQSPKNHLEAILCDADLDYLGRTDFFEIGNTLYRELKTHGRIDSMAQWNEIQVVFLEQHRFFTSTNISRRQAQKEIHLRQLKEEIDKKS